MCTSPTSAKVERLPTADQITGMFHETEERALNEKISVEYEEFFVTDHLESLEHEEAIAPFREDGQERSSPSEFGVMIAEDVVEIEFLQAVPMLLREVTLKDVDSSSRLGMMLQERRQGHQGSR